MESLQDYSSGADSDTAADNTQTTAKRRRTIPISSTAAARDGGAQLEIREIAADGRVRGFPHREGQFAASVFVPVRIVAGGDVHALLASVRHILRGLKLPMCHHSPAVDTAGPQSSERAIADQASIGSAHAVSAAASPAVCIADETDSLMNASALAAGWRLFGNDELHISLSRCVALKQPQLDAFLAEVKRAVSSSIRYDLTACFLPR
jgi:hypothetical protein